VVHWARVLENAERVAALANANIKVVRLFAIFHDARRVNDQRDPGHGARGGALARSMRARLDVTPEELDMLEYACAHHTDGDVHADPTIQACWDGDRLDLPRVGIRVKPHFLSPFAGDAAIIAWAHERAVRPHTPEFVTSWRVTA